MITNHKAVSRERVIGVSFVDILIQAVFLLFIALTIGYVDPIQRLRIKEFEQVGKDLCTKVNKDDPRECRQLIEPVVEREFGKGKLALCLGIDGRNRSVTSARFVVVSPTKARFIEFTPAYLQYLEEKGDNSRLALARSVKRSTLFDINEIDGVFGFMRESKCFHSVSHRNWEGSWDQRELDSIFSQITKLQNFSQ